MKFLIATLLTALLSFASALFFPWWIIAVAAFIIAVIIPQKPYLAFLSAFIALFLLWGIQAFIIDQSNNHILATRIADLITHTKSYILIIVITGIIGALVSGFGALTGSLFYKIVSERRNTSEKR